MCASVVDREVSCQGNADADSRLAGTDASRSTNSHSSERKDMPPASSPALSKAATAVHSVDSERVVSRLCADRLQGGHEHPCEVPPSGRAVPVPDAPVGSPAPLEQGARRAPLPGGRGPVGRLWRSAAPCRCGASTSPSTLGRGAVQPLLASRGSHSSMSAVARCPRLEHPRSIGMSSAFLNGEACVGQPPDHTWQWTLVALSLVGGVRADSWPTALRVT